MKRMMMGIAALALAGVTACDNLNDTQNSALGAAGGAAAGLLLADAFEANDNWTVVSALAGAAAGTLVARNAQTKTCAYARGDGTYYQAPCPS